MDEIINERNQITIKSLSLECPNCGAGPPFDDTEKVLTCPCCESLFLNEHYDEDAEDEEEEDGEYLWEIYLDTLVSMFDEYSMDIPDVVYGNPIESGKKLKNALSMNE